jgi:hypothetical protein
MVGYVVHSKVLQQVRETVELAGGERAEVLLELVSIELAPVDRKQGFVKLMVPRNDPLAGLAPGAAVTATFAPE